MPETEISLNTERATLPDDFGGEIDFVVRRANTRAELHDHVRWIGAEAINHLPDRVGDDTKLGAFATGMHKTDGRRFWIDNVNRATVCDVNAQRDTALIGDNAVAAREFLARCGPGDADRSPRFCFHESVPR